MDLLYHVADKVAPIEIKAGQTVSTDYFKSLRIFRKLGLNMLHKGMVVYAGETEQDRQEGHVLNFKNIIRELAKIERVE